MNKNKGSYIYYIALFGILCVLLGKCVEEVQDINKNNAKWQKEKLVQDYYNTKECESKGCDIVTIDCREYCYDKEIRDANKQTAK